MRLLIPSVSIIQRFPPLCTPARALTMTNRGFLLMKNATMPRILVISFRTPTNIKRADAAMKVLWVKGLKERISARDPAPNPVITAPINCETGEKGGSGGREGEP